MKKTFLSLAGALLLSAAGLAGAQDAKLTDAQIAAIVTAANTVEIDAAKLAKKKAGSKEVQAYAEQMIKDHEAMNKEAKKLAKDLKIKPEKNASAEALTKGGKDTKKKLDDLKGAEFDAAYVESNVMMHQTVLDTFDKSLLPSVQAPEMKASLEKSRAAIAQHLEHAKQLQSSLGGKKASGS